MAIHKNIYIGSGSNLGDREKNLLLAIKKINEQCGTVTAVSSLYTSEPWGKTDQPEFLNQVIAMESALSPVDLLKRLGTIEDELGRMRSEVWGPRTMDLDILFYDQQIIEEPGIVIPHPAIADRRFVLIPMCELNPSFMHPVYHKTCKELLDQCQDTLSVGVYGD